MNNYKYMIPKYVDESVGFFNGSTKGLFIFIPCLIIGIILFFSLSGMMKVLLPTLLVGGGYMLTSQRIGRELIIEIILNELHYKTQTKTLVWERTEE